MEKEEKEAEESSREKSKAWAGFSSLALFTSLSVMNWILFSLKARVWLCISQNTQSCWIISSRIKEHFCLSGWGGCFLYNLTWWLIPTLLPKSAEIIGKDFDFMWPLSCQSPGQKFASEQHLPVTSWCFSDLCLLPHCCRSQSTTFKLHTEGHESCTNQQHITFKNKYLVPRLRWAFFRDAHNDGTIWV